MTSKALNWSRITCIAHRNARPSTRFVKWSRCFVGSVVIEVQCTSIRECTFDSAISNLEGTMAKRKKAKTAAKKTAKKTKRKVAKKRK